MALSLGIAGTAFAANPFSDVRSDHWAYTSVAKLAQAGIIEGYGDDTFRGGRNITRYEMAQMVAKAMAKVDQADANQKAMIEKLAAEFSDELENLGVRVTKLEKNADNVRVTGDMRLRYMGSQVKFKDDGEKEKTNKYELRTRLYVTGEINDNFHAVGMLENIQKLNTNGRTGEDKTEMARAYVTGKIGAVDVTAGRFCYTPVYGIFYDDDMDGITLSFGSKLKATLSYGRMTSGGSGYGLSDDIVVGANAFEDTRSVDTLGLELSRDWDKWGVKAAVYSIDSRKAEGYALDVKDLSDIDSSPIIDKNTVYELALEHRFNEDFTLWGEYLRSSKDFNATGKGGYVGRLNYKNMDVAKKGSWGVYAMYYNLPAGTTMSTTLDLPMYEPLGIKAWEIGADYALMKNVQLHLAYADGSSKSKVEDSKADAKMAYAYLHFFF